MMGQENPKGYERLSQCHVLLTGMQPKNLNAHLWWLAQMTLWYHHLIYFPFVKSLANLSPNLDTGSKCPGDSKGSWRSFMVLDLYIPALRQTSQNGFFGIWHILRRRLIASRIRASPPWSSSTNLSPSAWMELQLHLWSFKFEASCGCSPTPFRFLWK